MRRSFFFRHKQFLDVPLLAQSGHRPSLALESFPPHWLIPRAYLCRMKFRFIRTSWEGKFPASIRPSATYLQLLRQMAGKKFLNLGSSSSPVTQARIMLIEMERGKKG